MKLIAHDYSVRDTQLPVWAPVWKGDPGWLYVIVNGSGLIKIGKTTNPRRRLKEAQTWIPDGVVAGMKPFWDIHACERTLLCGLAQHWFDGEWHDFPDESYSDFLLQGFVAFDDHDRNKNSLDFVYWMHEFGEILIEYNSRRISLRKWQREA